MAFEMEIPWQCKELYIILKQQNKFLLVSSFVSFKLLIMKPKLNEIDTLDLQWAHGLSKALC